jgi:hypothetical protein
MLFNYDSFEIVAIAFIVTGILIQSLYISSATPNNDSLINTLSNSDIGIQSNNLATTQLIDASVQTDANIQVAEASVQAANTYVNTGMQTSARMWLESIRNWITEILGTTGNTPATGQYVDVGVQTNPISLWDSVKQWFLEVCSIRSSELSSMGYNKVTKWRNKLDSDQSVDLQNSDSSLTTLKFGSDSELQNLVDPNESASQISEVVSNSATNINSNRIYDMNNAADVLDLMNDPTVVFSINPATLPGDDLITFHTADSSNEILRACLDTLLTGVN